MNTMSELSSFQTLQALSDLLTPPCDSDEDDVENVRPSARMGPGHIGPPAVAEKADREVTTPYEEKNSKNIWEDGEVVEGAEFDDLSDPRPQPEYDVILKQSVGTEDLFLGMSRKDPSSMCCESILVKVKLPETKASEVVLDVKETFLDLRTPKFKLGFHLPHAVHHEDGKAKFFSEQGELVITLPMNRPMDDVNLP
ncbi:dynein axonemal assembly factor 6 [Denticeps clupeoides]|uniref:dynein axonemal assembly factor 6 n=1 Tax=Denticeps clupeoides TaxID=299321 RepID=UPI0010A3ACE1|nr:protein PIH1D3 [Denticeps clupeoides]